MQGARHTVDRRSHARRNQVASDSRRTEADSERELEQGAVIRLKAFDDEEERKLLRCGWLRGRGRGACCRCP